MFALGFGGSDFQLEESFALCGISNNGMLHEERTKETLTEAITDVLDGAVAGLFNMFTDDDID